MADRLTVTIAGEEREIFLSYGLLSELAQIVQSAEGVQEMDLDPYVAMKVIDTFLAPRDSRGRIIEKDFVAPEIDVNTAEKILEFCGEACLSFFLTGLRRGIRRLETRKSELLEVGRSLNSGVPSLSASQS